MPDNDIAKPLVNVAGERTLSKESEQALKTNYVYNLLREKFKLSPRQALTFIANASLGIEPLYAAFIGITAKQALDYISLLIPMGDYRIISNIINSIIAAYYATRNLNSDLHGGQAVEEVKAFFEANEEGSEERAQLAARLKKNLSDKKVAIKNPLQLQEFVKSWLPSAQGDIAELGGAQSTKSLMTDADKKYLDANLDAFLNARLETNISTIKKDIKRILSNNGTAPIDQETKTTLDALTDDECQCLHLKLVNPEVHKVFFKIQANLNNKKLSVKERLAQLTPEQRKSYEIVYKINYTVFTLCSSVWGGLSDVFPILDLVKYFDKSTATLLGLGVPLTLVIEVLTTAYYHIFSNEDIQSVSMNLLGADPKALIKTMYEKGFIGIEAATQLMMAPSFRGLTFAYIPIALAVEVLGWEYNNPALWPVVGTVWAGSIYGALLSRGEGLWNSTIRNKEDREKIQYYKETYGKLPLSSEKALKAAGIPLIRAGSAAVLYFLIASQTNGKNSETDIIATIGLFIGILSLAYLGNRGITHEAAMLEDLKLKEANKEKEKEAKQSLLSPTVQETDKTLFNVVVREAEYAESLAVKNQAKGWSRDGRIIRLVSAVTFLDSLSKIAVANGWINSQPTIPMILALTGLVAVLNAVMDKQTFDRKNIEALCGNKAKWDALDELNAVNTEVQKISAKITDAENTGTYSPVHDATSLTQQSSLSNDEIKDAIALLPSSTCNPEQHSRWGLFLTAYKSELQHEINQRVEIIKKAKARPLFRDLFPANDSTVTSPLAPASAAGTRSRAESNDSTGSGGSGGFNPDDGHVKLGGGFSRFGANPD